MTLVRLHFVEMFLDRASDLCVVAVSFLCLMVMTRFFLKKSTLRKGQRELPGPPALPIIGHLHLFGKLPHQILKKFSDQYGPLLSVKLGTIRIIVASDAEMAEEFLKTQDGIWASRPPSLFADAFFYNGSGLVMQPHNEYWRKMRKLYVTEFFAPLHIEKMKEQRHDSVMRFVNSLLADGKGSKPTQVESKLSDMTFYHVTRVVLGKKASLEDFYTPSGERKSVKKLVRDLTSVDFLSLGQCFPYLRWLDLDGVEKRLKRLHIELDAYLTTQLEQRTRRILNEEDDDSVESEVVHILMSMVDSKDENGLTLNNAKGALTDIILGSVETTGAVMSMTIAEIMRNPEVQKKIVAELDDVVGRERLLEESDLVHLKYLKLVIKESLRLHPPVPLMVPHMSTAPSVVAGYHFPANTQLFINVYAIQRDPKLWEDPLSFKPERFLDSSIDLRGHHFHLLPFGTGRRVCPGMNLALSLSEFCLARLFHSLDMSLPPGVKPEDVDTFTEDTGVAVRLSNPVDVLVNPRLPLELYTK